MSSSTSEYTNTLTSNLYNIYAVPPMYNSIIAEKLPSSVPSQSFPTILVQDQKEFGYNSLTHDSDLTGYYSRNSAYGSNCEPPYVVAKCPDNRVIRPFHPKDIISSANIASPHTNITEGYNSPPKILFFTKDGCIHCKKAYDEYKQILGSQFDEIFIVKNVSNPANLKELQQYGASGLPFFVSASSSRPNSVLGHRPFHQLLNELNVNSSTPSSNQNVEDIIKQLQIVVLTIPNCIHCKKVKELLAPYSKDIMYAKANHPLQGIVKGFPFIMSERTKKSYLGTPSSIQELIKALH